MRLIGKALEKNHARQLSIYLKSVGIENECEPARESQGQAFQIWVADEDRLQEAETIFEQFLQDPADPNYQVAYAAPLITQNPPHREEVKEKPLPRRLVAPLTTFLIGLCALVYFLNVMQEAQLTQSKKPQPNLYFFTPIQQTMLFDLPTAFSSNASQEGIKISLEEMQEAPYWKGFYDYLVLKFQGKDTASVQGALFTKIRQGEFWRLFSPCILHLSFLHILFNMIWLWVLGRPVEQRIGLWRTLLLTLVIGILTNTAQYVMSGPFFLGYSGVVMGLAGFIWMREKIAPWEGYPLHKTTILFLAIYVFSMFALQLISFLLQIFTQTPFVLNIANTAHLLGAVLGALLARLPYFAWRVK